MTIILSIILLLLPHTWPKIMSLVMTEQHELSLCHCHHCWVLEHSQWLCCTIYSDFLRVLYFICQELHKCPSHDQSSCCLKTWKIKCPSQYIQQNKHAEIVKTRCQRKTLASTWLSLKSQLRAARVFAFYFLFPNTAARILSSYSTNKNILRDITSYFMHTHKQISIILIWHAFNLLLPWHLQLYSHI